MQSISPKLKYEEMTPTQLAMVHSMKELLLQKGVTDPTFTLFHVARFCMSRSFDLSQIRPLMDQYTQFYHKKIEQRILGFPCLPIDLRVAKALGDGFSCVDKKWRPVFVIQVGKKKVQELLSQFGFEALETFYVQLFERFLHIMLPICSAKKGKRVTKCVAIVDLKDSNIASYITGKGREFVQRVASMPQTYFPHILKRVYVINSPAFFESAWKILRKFMHPNTAAKFQIFKGVPSQRLQADIDPSNLHVNFSGTRTDDIISCPGPWSEEYDLSLQRNSLRLNDKSAFLQYFCTPEERQLFVQKPIERPLTVASFAEVPSLNPPPLKNVVITTTPSISVARSSVTLSSFEQKELKTQSRSMCLPPSADQSFIITIPQTKTIKKSNFRVSLSDMKRGVNPAQLGRV